MARPKRKHSPRQRTKPNAEMRKRRLRLLESLVCLIVLTASGLGFYHFISVAPYFLVSTLRIEGMKRLNEEAVRAVAGITSEDNVLFLDTQAIKDRVEAIPYVKTCTVSRVFPDTVSIRFIEREPLATVLINSRLFEVDAEGVLLRELEPLTPHTGPFITNLPGVAYAEVGDRISTQVLQHALEVWSAFSSVPMAESVTVSEIAAMSDSNILMFCDNLDYEIRWGRLDARQQAHTLDIFWRAQKGEPPCGEYLDLRFEDEVACR